MTPTDAEALIREHTRIAPAPFVPRFRLYQASALVPVWQATESDGATPPEPPFWAFAWPGSQALAAYLLANPELVRGRRVLDFGAGNGLAAIVAAHLGAAHVLACDVDPLAVVAQQLNAELNGVAIESQCVDPTRLAPETDVILAGDVCYEREAAERTTAWLRSSGSLVLLADPGRHYVPTAGLELLASYDVPTLMELESVRSKRTRLWRLVSASSASSA